MNFLGFQELWEKLISGDESVEIEAKRAESSIGRSIIETVSAFSNEPGRGGGYLLLGVDAAKEDPTEPSYRVSGVADADKIQADLATQCRTLFSIPIRPQITLHVDDGKIVLVVFVPEVSAHDKPVYIKSQGLSRGAYRRIGSTTQTCTEEDIEYFYQDRTHKTFDETTVVETSFDDVDPVAVAEYRRARAEVNPNASELAYSDSDLLDSLAATSRGEGNASLTIAGLMLFGKEAAIRRHFPMARVDYIRVEGREWVPDPERRYQAVEMRGPLLILLPRIIAHVLSDIPIAFALSGSDVHRRDVPIIPRTVIREAVVNALMHRSYRQRSPVQIIRYSNRIEIRNPGHSLIPDERLGEPGSVARNEKLAAVLHEVGLAETKGTGIRAMREAMIRANLTLPTFESDRQKDTFTVLLLVLHLLGPEDLAWLERFKDLGLSEDEARALIFVREVGAIDNLSYRSINSLDTLKASGRLRRLRDFGLIEQKAQGNATFYAPTARLLGRESVSLSEELNPSDKALPEGLPSLPEGFPPLPPSLADIVKSLGQRSNPKEVRAVIAELCAWHPLRPVEIAAILNRNSDYVRNTYLTPMIRDGVLKYLHPDNPAHPQQAYVARQHTLFDSDPE